MSKTTVLVVGATSTIGGHVVNQLAGLSDLSLVAGVRSAEKAKPFQDRGITTVQLDLSSVRSIREAVEGIDRIFLLTGYTVDMLNQSKMVVDQAVAAGAQQMVHMGAWAPDDTDLAHFGWHQFVERYIEGSGLGWTHVSPGMFMENMLGSGSLWGSFVEPAVKHSRAIHAFTGQGRLGWIAAEDIARVCVAALRNPAKHASKKYNLSVEVRSVPEIAEILTQTLGHSFHAEIIEPELFYQALLKGGMEPNYAACARETLSRFGKGSIPGQGQAFPYESIDGVTAMDWASFARKHSAQFLAIPA